ncbi:hypothetical protein GCM10010191_61340 [Actinomadura vinacea]|uniref:Uncharacterized protein n=1 Tax=Actinomadura vinacea TaxID=115336 RepID=A0ABN3JUC0_9ACTN
MGQKIAAEVKETEAPQLSVDEWTIDQTVAEVERFFAGVLAKGPTADTADERPALLRWANRADVERYRAFYARPWSTGSFDSAVHAFACECARPECDAQVELALIDFPAPSDAASPVLAAGHHMPEN